MMYQLGDLGKVAVITGCLVDVMRVALMLALMLARSACDKCTNYTHTRSARARARGGR